MPIFGHSRGGGGGRGFNPRILIALVIAVIGIVGFLSKKSINPVTGEKQYVNLNPKQEIALGLQAAPEMAKQMGGVLDPEKDPQAKIGRASCRERGESARGRDEWQERSTG